MGTVVGFEGSVVLVDLDGPAGRRYAEGIIAQHELSWRSFTHPSEIVHVGQSIAAEVMGADQRTGRLSLSAKACEDPELRTFLLGVRRGEIRAGTIAEIQNFGVFVSLDGEPAHHRTGFINVAELSWEHINHPSDVVRVGQRITTEVLAAETYRGQVSLSLKALQEDPFIPLADRLGEIVRGHVTKVVPIGVFVRIVGGIEGLIPYGEHFAPGTELTVQIVEVDLQRRRVRLSPSPAASSAAGHRTESW